MIQIAVIGDIHGQFDERDVTTFNASGYDLCLCVGDLCRFVSPQESLAVARRLAGLTPPTVVIPGNHDVASLAEFVAELRGWRRLAGLVGRRGPRHHERLRRALAPASLGGYSLHTFQIGGEALDIIVGRPYAMGGSDVSFAPLLEACYGVGDAEASTARLKALVDAGTAEQVIFLAHNGPYGLGSAPDDPWGCDFDPERGDFGDRDLSVAIDHARARGRRVLAVVAGHMHRRSKGGLARRWLATRHGTLYVNAAEVPRITVREGGVVYHHVSLSLERGVLTVNDVRVEMEPLD